MRKLVVYELISLDGVAEDPDKFITEWDAMMDSNLASVIGDQDAVILGRRSYDEWANYWPKSDMQPFSDFINNVMKYVVTSSELTPEWNLSSAIEGDLVAFIEDLKTQQGRSIGVHASISVANTLLQAGVVDELCLVIAPRIAGVGQKLFDGLSDIKLTLKESLVSPSGYFLVTYTASENPSADD